MSDLVPAYIVAEPEVEEAEGVAVGQSLVRPSSIREMVRTFAHLEATVRATFAAIVAAENACNDVFTLGDRQTIQVSADYHGNHGGDFDKPDRAIERIRRAAWRCLADRLECRRWMSAEGWKKLDHALDHNPPEPITDETVTTFAQRHRANAPALFSAKVAECFDWMRPRSSESRRGRYATNQRNARLEIGERIILTGLVEKGDHGRFHVSHYHAQRLTALDAVFSALDGQGFGASTHYGPLHDAIECCTGGKGTTRYFAFKAHKNGTLHLQFLHLNLLRRFNAIAGGANLRPASDATHA